MIIRIDSISNGFLTSVQGDMLERPIVKFCGTISEVCDMLKDMFKTKTMSEPGVISKLRDELIFDEPGDPTGE